MKGTGKSSYLPSGIIDSTYGHLKDTKGAIGGYASKLSTRLEVATDKLADKVEAGLVKSENKIDYFGNKFNSLDIDKLPNLPKEVNMTIGLYIANLASGYAGIYPAEDALARAVLAGLLYGIARRAPDALKHIEITENEGATTTTLYDKLQNLYHHLGDTRISIRK